MRTHAGPIQDLSRENKLFFGMKGNPTFTWRLSNLRLIRESRCKCLEEEYLFSKQALKRSILLTSIQLCLKEESWRQWSGTRVTHTVIEAHTD